MCNLEALIKGCETNPKDWLALGVLADFLEEHDDPDTAYALRWMVKYTRRPKKRRYTVNTGDKRVLYYWEYSHYILSLKGRKHASNVLPMGIWRYATGNYYNEWFGSVKQLGKAIKVMRQMLEV